jgi:hypothetical protein
MLSIIYYLRVYSAPQMPIMTQARTNKESKGTNTNKTQKRQLVLFK